MSVPRVLCFMKDVCLRPSNTMPLLFEGVTGMSPPVVDIAHTLPITSPIVHLSDWGSVFQERPLLKSQA